MIDFSNLDVSREIQYKLNAYTELLFTWNKKINLVSKNINLEQHIIDCLQLMKMIKDTDIHLVDVGSGAGLPGLILSTAGLKKVTLVEPNNKKAAFLLHASSISSNKVEVISARVEEVNLDCDILTSKALANVNIIFEYTEHIKVRDRYLLLTTNKYDELTKAQQKWRFDIVVHDSIIFNAGKILEISSLTKKYE